MKVCHFISSIGLGRGEFYIDLVNELSQHAKLYLLIPQNAKFLHRINSRITVIEYQAKDTRLNPFLLIEIYKHLKTIQPDIVHTHFAKATEIFYWINKILGFKHIATKHNPRKGKIFNKIAYVTAVSKKVAQSIQNENVKVIYNGLIPLNIQPQSKQNAIFTLCCVGRLDKIKGYDILIQECSKLSFDFVLNIIGDGDEKENLSKLIQELKLEDKVFLCGFREDIETIMSCSDLVVISSHSEGFSLVMVEALFYAPMLISTRVSGAIEILSNTFLIDGFHIADKINMLHTHYNDFRIEFDTLRDRTKNNFLLSHIALEYIDYYHEVLQNA